MIGELTTSKKAIAQFDIAKKSVAEIEAKLKRCVLTDRGSRETLFNFCRDADRIRKMIEAKRLELLRPIAEEKKRLKNDFIKSIEPLDDLKKNIENYSKKILVKPLEDAIGESKSKIIIWDRTEEERKAEEQRKIEAERQRVEEEARRKEEQARQEAEAREKKIEADRREAEEAAAKKKGIAAKIAKEKADRDAAEAKEQAELEAAEKIKNAKIDAAMDRSAIQDREEDLNKKSKGREKEEVTWEVTGIDMVPEKYIIKKIDRVAVDLAVKEGTREIPGIKIIVNKTLKFV